MKILFFSTLILALAIVVPVPTMAGVDVNVSIALPPPIVFAAPPELIVLPETYVYVAPDVNTDIFFYNGWWWRPWEGRWYRSRDYKSGWAYYQRVPSFYAGIPSGWRNDYRDHRWGGHEWNYQRIPQQQVQRNWKGWQKSKYWEKQQSWGVKGLKPQARSHQPAQAVHSKTQAKPQLREAAKPQSRPQSKEVQPEHSQQQHRVTPQESKPREGKPERGDEEKEERK
jgi:hypothetical protein